MASRNFHEDLARHDDEPRASERNLGVTFAVVLALIGALRLYRGSDAGFYWLAAAAAFLVCAYFWTAPPPPLKFVWHRLRPSFFTACSPTLPTLLFYPT